MDEVASVEVARGGAALAASNESPLSPKPITTFWFRYLVQPTSSVQSCYPDDLAGVATESQATKTGSASIATGTG